MTRLAWIMYYLSFEESTSYLSFVIDVDIFLTVCVRKCAKFVCQKNTACEHLVVHGMHVKATADNCYAMVRGLESL